MLIQAREAAEKAGANPEQQAQAHYDLGRELAQKGKNAEALTEYLWCFDVGMKKAPSQRGVRGSFLLGDIATLGAHYPPALDALKTRRDRDQKLLPGDCDAASEFGAINHSLDDDALTMTAFEQFPADRTLRAALGRWIFDKLIDAKRYADAIDAFPFNAYKKLFTKLSSSPNPSDAKRA